MRVLITVFTYPPNADGVSQAASVLANGLAGRGHDVTVATAYHPQRGPAPAGSNPRVEQFKVSGNGNWQAGIQGEWRAYREFLRKFACDVIVFENWDIWSTHLALPLLKELGAKKVLVSHGYASHRWWPRLKFAWGLGPWLGGLPLVLAMPFVMRRYDQLVVLSHSVGWNVFLDVWVARVTRFKRLSVIPNGAYMTEFAENGLDFRAQYGIGAGPLLLCVANYCDRKNQMMAVRAFRRAGLDGATLAFIGSEFNDYSRQLSQLDEQFKRDHPAGRVLLLENVGRPMTCAAYRTADLFVLSAKHETQPIVLLEAMASRTPFVSTDTGCVRELPGGVVVRSESEMAATIRDLIASPEERQKLSSAGLDACRTTYDWERVVDSYERMLTRLVGSGPVTGARPSSSSAGSNG